MRRCVLRDDVYCSLPNLRLRSRSAMTAASVRLSRRAHSRSRAPSPERSRRRSRSKSASLRPSQHARVSATVVQPGSASSQPSQRARGSDRRGSIATVLPQGSASSQPSQRARGSVQTMRGSVATVLPQRSASAQPSWQLIPDYMVDFPLWLKEAYRTLAAANLTCCFEMGCTREGEWFKFNLYGLQGPSDADSNSVFFFMAPGT